MRDRLAAISLFLCLGLILAGSGRAVPVEALYEATVAGDSTEVGRAPAAAEALRQVVVRVTGRSAAAADASLQGLYAEASRLAQTFRTLAPGQMTVAFDPDLVESALVKAGQRLWGRERPQFLVILEGGAAQQAGLRKDIQAAGQVRGIPWIFADSRVDPPAGVREGMPDALRGVARTFGSDGVLLLKLNGSVVTAVWAGPAGDGSATGTPLEIVDTLADRLGSALAVSAAESGRLSVTVHGVTGLSAYAAVLGQINALPAVRSVAVESITASAMKLRVLGPGDVAGLRKSAHDSGHFDVVDAGGGRAVELVYRP